MIVKIMMALLIIFIALFILLGILVSFDVIPYIKNIFGRRGIGCYDDDEWAFHVEKRAVKWLEKGIPVVPRVAGNRLTFIDRLNGSYKADSIGYWQKASLLAAVNKTNAEIAADIIYDELAKNTFIESWATDAASLGYAMLCNESIDKVEIRATVNILAEALIDKFRATGSIPYSQKSRIRFVDTIGLVCPFLIKYAVIYSDNEKLNAAISLIKEYGEYGLHKNFKLPVHCFDPSNKAPLGIYGWGRGCGWWAVGLADSFYALSSSDGYEEEKRMVLEYYLEFCNTIIKYQCDNGAFDRNVLCFSGEDSSATAMIAMALAYAGKITGKRDYSIAARQAIEYLFTVTRRDGTVDYSQGDTMGVGFYSQASIVVPAAQGFALRAYYILEE
ncbi:MAG: glycoside hydrolase family 88 protein [Clostridia bacterium]|nr:glycoside hydrolase family 88 protein [Clostridia bacterium]